MDTAEHFYSDDPAEGHPDVRTRIPDTDYFFLGNGFIHAAVQVCRSGEATPVGLVLMDPNRFGAKRASLTCHPATGLSETMLQVRVGGRLHAPRGEQIVAGWTEVDGIPAVEVRWEAYPVQVQEIFVCLHARRSLILRKINLRVSNPGDGPVVLQMGSGGTPLPLSPDQAGEARTTLVHEVRVEGDRAHATHALGPSDLLIDAGGPGGENPSQAPYWSSLTRIHTGHPTLDPLFRAARAQLPISVDRRGRMDGSIWQYNLEWVRDQAHVAEALVRLGDPEKARVMLARLLDFFVSPEGDTVDSGRRRPAAEVELDQNGTLLSALSVYLDWTGDRSLVEERWTRIQALADFPFQERFRHGPSGLLHNRREYWERHAGHGIQDGFELMSQFAVAMGLAAASRVAGELGHTQDAARWARRAHALKKAMLEDPRFRLVENGLLIKRRGTDGQWQGSISLPPGSSLPGGVPLAGDSLHALDPDTSATLPIAHGFIPPDGELARNTLDHVETLWNQLWEGGGYGRYNATSEPDSPGAWPFASLFVARAYTEAGNHEKVWRALRWLNETRGGRSGAWFENDGPRISPPYPQVGITPWTWAEIVTLFVHHFLGFRPDGEGILIRPRLLSGLEEIQATLRVRGYRIRLRVRRGGNGERRIPYPTSDIDLDLFT